MEEDVFEREIRAEMYLEKISRKKFKRLIYLTIALGILAEAIAITSIIRRSMGS